MYSLSLQLPKGVGQAHVHFAVTPSAVPEQEHPVEIDLEADTLMFHPDDLDRQERKRAKVRERAILRQLRTVCTALDPAYARMGAEDGYNTPTPAELASGERSLGGSVFVSHRLATRPEVSPALATLAGVTKTLDWGTGTHFEWGPARAERELKAMRAAGQAVSLAVGRVLTAR